VTTRTQAVVLTLVGALLVRISLTGEYTRFVNEWLRWPLLATGALLVLVSFAHLFARSEEEGEHDHGVPFSAWLLLAPVFVVFVVAPPALGSYVAERRSNSYPPPDYVEMNALPAGEVVETTVSDFVVRAQYDPGRSLEDRTVAMIGFVSTDKRGDWYLTRLSVGCCAADASAYKIKVGGDVAQPPEDSWVRLTGQWVPVPEEQRGVDTPEILAQEVVATEEPAQPYE
jgi:uncharacterized repeat protein (TIGR03943 family)